jgi:glycerophosphoryl diester phosphodiesterase
VEAGAGAVEFDVQLTADGIPVVVHDPDLRRTAGLDLALADLSFADRGRVDVSERARLGPGRAPVPLPSLAEVAAWLAATPGPFAFVEVKRESAERVGVATMVDEMLAVLAPVRERCVIISFVEEAIVAAKRRGAATGWCLNHYDDASRRFAERTRPQFLVCDHHKLPVSPTLPWPGPWRWMSYEVTSAPLARQLLAQGVELIETMDCGGLMVEPGLFQDPG